MILVNLCGGPGSGKTTLAYYLAYRLKKEGYRAELVGEAAREEHIYDAPPGHVPPPLIDNQLLVAGQQYERILRLERHGMQVAISDSPLIQGVMYGGPKITYRDELEKLLRTVEAQFTTYNIFVKRQVGRYDSESRVQGSEAEAASYDIQAAQLIKSFWQTVTRNDATALGLMLLTELNQQGVRCTT